MWHIPVYVYTNSERNFTNREAVCSSDLRKAPHSASISMRAKLVAFSNEPDCWSHTHTNLRATACDRSSRTGSVLYSATFRHVAPAVSGEWFPAFREVVMKAPWFLQVSGREYSTSFTASDPEYVNNYTVSFLDLFNIIFPVYVFIWIVWRRRRRSKIRG